MSNLCTVKGCPFEGRYCRLHLQARVKEPAPIQKVSKKQAAELSKDYAKVRAEYLKEHPFCEVRGCGRKSTEIHHKEGRTGELLTDKTKFLAVCREDHRKIEQNPAWARQEGYSNSRHKAKTL